MGHTSTLMASPGAALRLLHQDFYPAVSVRLVGGVVTQCRNGWVAGHVTFLTVCAKTEVWGL